MARPKRISTRDIDILALAEQNSGGVGSEKNETLNKLKFESHYLTIYKNKVIEGNAEKINSFLKHMKCNHKDIVVLLTVLQL